MNFTSIPAAYLDAAANWQQQQQNHQHENSGSAASHQQLLPSVAAVAAPEAPAQPHGGSIRPGSMSDRARMANLPMPEAALKCPRCESTNTKFCYFNNYSLSQPRHFCKTCRRYWTRGGALRNVPVGGGCRRNKRTKGGGGGGSSKSPAASSDRQTGSTCSANSASSNSGATHNDHMVGLSPHMASLRFMAPLHHNQHQLTDFGGGDNNMGLNNYGLSYNSPIPGPMGDLSFQLGSSSGGGGGVGGLEQWRMMNNNMPQTVHQQFQFHPFLAGLEGINITSPQASSSLLYPFDQGNNNNNNNNNTNSEEVITTTTTTGSLLYGGGGLMMRPRVSNSGVMTQQQASVKMEDSNNIRDLNLSNQFLGSNSVVQGSEQYNWTNTSDVAGAAGTCAANWTDVSGFSSSSTTSNHM